MYDFNELIKNPGVIAAAVILFLMLFVFVPLMIRRARRQRRTAKNYIPDLIRMTGLQQTDNGFEGTFKGFPTVLRMGVGYNYAEAGFEALKGLSGGTMDFHGRNMVYQKFSVEMDLPAMAPDFILKEKVGILRTDQYIMDKFAGKELNLPEIKPTAGKLKKVRLFGNDADMANKLAGDRELKDMISRWYYTDIRVSGNKLIFTLDDNMVNPTFGPKRVAKPQFIVDGVNIAARVAQIVSN